MKRETVMEWLNKDHRRTVHMFAKEHGMTESEVWKVLNAQKGDDK